MRLDFFKGFKPLSKTFRPKKVEPYPLVKRVTSYSVEVTKLQDYYQALVEHASYGCSLLKGHFLRPLTKESKANEVDREEYTQTLILDIDGLSLDTDLLGHWDADRVKNVACEVLSLFPPEFQKTNFIACASSSCGIKNNVRLHLHFMLGERYAPKQIKILLKSLNIVIPHIRSALTLTSTGKSLKFIIDPCLADNTRGVFIAPPNFEEVANPFDNDEDRIVLINDRPKNFLDIEDLLNNMPNEESIEREIDAIIKHIHKKRGTRYTKAQSAIKLVDGVKHTVLKNPDPNTMTLSYCNDKFAYYNIGRGDSNAYYVPLDNPEIVFNFKGESKFLFKAMDSNAYDEHKKRFETEINEAQIAKGTVIPKIHMDGDTYTCSLFNPSTNEIEQIIEIGKTKAAENLFANYGQDLPEIIPLGQKTFNPKSNEPYEEDDLTKMAKINTFKPTPFMKQTMEYPVPIEYDPKMDDDGVQRLPAPIFRGCCPTLMKVITHMLGDDEECVNHFINWFATVWQKREKPETTWLAQGTQGTGKGMFFRRVIRPLYGDYAQEKMLNNIEDTFTGWIENVMFLMMDEVNISNAKSRNIDETLKHWISEDVITIRGMRKDQRTVKSHFATMMLSNEHGAVTIEAGDRRYNVAPRQEVKIDHKYPEINNKRDEFDAQCDRELPALVMLLNSMNINEAAARRCLNNAAKTEVSAAAMSIAERFCAALKTGDLYYLGELLFLVETNTDNNIRLKKAQGIVKRLVVGLNDQTGLVLQEDLRHVFAAFEQRDIAPNRFGRMLTKFGVTQCRKRAGMFISVDWQIKEDDLNILHHALTPTEIAQMPNIPQQR